MVGSQVAGAGQVQHLGADGLRCCVGRPTTTMAVSQGDGTLPLVRRQNAPGVACAHSHQPGCLVHGHLLCPQAVQDLEPRLFFLVQRHILHRGDCDIYADQLVRTFSLTVDTEAGPFRSARMAPWLAFAVNCRHRPRETPAESLLPCQSSACANWLVDWAVWRTEKRPHSADTTA